MKNKEFIIILNFETVEIIISKYDSNIVEDSKEYLDIISEEKGIKLNSSNCQWMVVKDELNINYI